MSELLIGTNPEKPAVVGSINLSATKRGESKAVAQALRVSHFVCDPRD
jgi:hypothetical protein